MLSPHDTKEFAILSDKFKSEKEINVNFTKTHENSIYPFTSVKCACDKCTEEEVCDSLLD